MNRYVVQVRSLMWPAPEYSAWNKGPYRCRLLARVMAWTMRRDRLGLWREAEVVEVPWTNGRAGEERGDGLRDEAAAVPGPR